MGINNQMKKSSIMLLAIAAGFLNISAAEASSIQSSPIGVVLLNQAGPITNGKTACETLWPNYKCCIPFVNNTFDVNLQFTYTGVATEKVMPQQVGALYMKDGSACPQILNNGINLRVTNLSTSKDIPSVPLAKPFSGISCDSKTCKVWG